MIDNLDVIIEEVKCLMILKRRKTVVVILGLQSKLITVLELNGMLFLQMTFSIPVILFSLLFIILNFNLAAWPV